MFIQTGDQPERTGGAGRQIDDEISDLAFIEGTVAMATLVKTQMKSVFYYYCCVQETLMENIPRLLE